MTTKWTQTELDKLRTAIKELIEPAEFEDWVTKHLPKKNAGQAVARLRLLPDCAPDKWLRELQSYYEVALLEKPAPVWAPEEDVRKVLQVELVWLRDHGVYLLTLFKPGFTKLMLEWKVGWMNIGGRRYYNLPKVRQRLEAMRAGAPVTVRTLSTAESLWERRVTRLEALFARGGITREEYLKQIQEGL